MAVDCVSNRKTVYLKTNCVHFGRGHFRTGVPHANQRLTWQKISRDTLEAFKKVASLAIFHGAYYRYLLFKKM